MAGCMLNSDEIQRRQSTPGCGAFVLSDKIFSRVRYAVIRPCGPKAGVNLLADCKPAEAPPLGINLNADKTVRVCGRRMRSGLGCNHRPT
jgi:hypothetical protein